MQPFDTSPVKPARPPGRPRVGRVVALIVLGAFGVFCCLPVGGFGAWYLSLESGPHTSLPDACTTLTGEAIRALVGDAAGEHERKEVAGKPHERCYWTDAETPSRTALWLSATLHERTPVESSVDEARSSYRYALLPLTRHAERAIVAGRAVTGLGQESWCAGETANRSRVRYGCAVRDGNVLVELTVEPTSPPASGRGDGPLDEAGLAAVVDRFVAEVATPVLRDYVEDL